MRTMFTSINHVELSLYGYVSYNNRADFYLHELSSSRVYQSELSNELCSFTILPLVKGNGFATSNS
jgi:hypothetical protein